MSSASPALTLALGYFSLVACALVRVGLWFQRPFNDLFIAWLESEAWTGNISFDEMGNPISLNAGFLDFKAAPELGGTALHDHAATRWLRTKVGVRPGERIRLSLLMIDLADDYLDSTVLLDDFRWECTGGDPDTTPEG